jgi:ComF family protein
MWGQTFRFAQNTANLVLSGLFEPPCAACGDTLARPLDGAVCDRCWSDIHRITPPLCDRCGDPLPSSLVGRLDGGRCHLCRIAVGAVDRSRAVGAYEGRLRDIIHALKYDGRRSIAPRLAGLLRAAGADLLAGADGVVPVPLHPRRERARGFNQATDLARGLGLPVMPLLERTRATRPQVDLTEFERHRNVTDAFAVSKTPGSLFGLSFSPPKNEPSVLVLIDDVTTTGATLEACARVLKAAGVREVRALTAARVVSGRP